MLIQVHECVKKLKILNKGNKPGEKMAGQSRA